VDGIFIKFPNKFYAEPYDSCPLEGKSFLL